MRLALPFLRAVHALPLRPSLSSSAARFIARASPARALAATMATTAEATRKALRKQMFIGGKFVDADGGATFDVTDPCTGGVSIWGGERASNVDGGVAGTRRRAVAAAPTGPQRRLSVAGWALVRCAEWRCARRERALAARASCPPARALTKPAPPSHLSSAPTPQVLAPAAAASSAQVDAAVEAAAAAFPAWAALSNAERAGWLRKLADELEKRKPEAAAVEALNTGKPLREAQGDVDDACAAFRYCAGLAEKGRGVEHIQPDQAALPDPNFAGSSIIYEPVGVVAGILPFNFPLMMGSWKVGPALAAGCTIVLKPSEFTPFSILELCAAAEAISLPAGVLNVVTGAGAIGAGACHVVWVVGWVRA
jgi:acyl-CoA reductase-like NAD-dependent aldehyde dehydrogenase